MRYMAFILTVINFLYLYNSYEFKYSVSGISKFSPC